MMPYSDPEKRRARYHQNAESRRAAMRANYAKHREKRLAYAKAKREEDVEAACARQRAQYAKHREKRVEEAREYRRKKRDEVNAKAVARYHANKETICERRRELDRRPEARAKQYAHQRRWLKKNPDKALLMHAKRLLNEQTGIRIADIQNELAEVKVAQLNVSRLGRELLFPPPYKKEKDSADPM